MTQLSGWILFFACLFLWVSGVFTGYGLTFLWICQGG